MKLLKKAMVTNKKIASKLVDIASLYNNDWTVDIKAVSDIVPASIAAIDGSNDCSEFVHK